ncbi:MAG: META domain-containing protein [Rhizobiaceae bacterium]
MLSLIQKIGVAATILVAAAATQAKAAEILLQSALTGSYVRTQGGAMVANGHADNATRFEMIRLEGTRVAFRVRGGSYVRAGVGQQTLLAAGSPHIRGWETFEMVRGNNGTSLRSIQNGKFVMVDNRTGRLRATARARGVSTEFQMVGAPRDTSASGNSARTPQVQWTGSWRNVWIASPNGNLHRPPAGSRVEFVIDADMSVRTTMGCNRMGTRLTIDGQRARFAAVMSTKMNCANEQQGYENGLGMAMDKVRSWEFREGQVAFLDRSGRTVMQIGR